MRKQTKLVAVLSAAALLAIGASMTSFAAKGWVEENGSWYYYNSNGDYVTNDWQKSGNNWFWLGDDGAMVTDTLVEDGNYKYYVNANGAMVTNSWVAVEPGDDDYDDAAPDHYWYYFGANGKAYKAADSSKGLLIKTINGKKYGFDTESKMVYGFVQEDGAKNTDENPFVDAMYYFGDADDGAMHTDWLQYMDGSDLQSSSGDKEYSDMDEMWFFFDTTSGKMVKADNGDNMKTKTIRGQKYGFDELGVMTYEWNYTASNSLVPTSSSAKFFSDVTDGHLKKKNWIYAVPTEDMQNTIGNTDYDDETSRWFYADGTGKTVKNEIKKIGGKKYLFNAVGEMESGLQWVDDSLKKQNTLDFIANNQGDERTAAKETLVTNNGQTIQGYTATQTGNYELYYFSADGDADGSMKTGKNIKIDLDDDSYTFGFKTTGEAYNYNRPKLDKEGKQMVDKDNNPMFEGLTDKKIYLNGVLQKAASDDRYVVIGGSMSELQLSDGNAYVVGTSGTIVGKGKYVKNGNDDWYAVPKVGVVEFISGSDDYADDIARCKAQGKTDDQIKEKLDSNGELRGYSCN